MEERTKLLDIERRKNESLRQESRSSSSLRTSKSNESDFTHSTSAHHKVKYSPTSGSARGAYDESSDPETDQVDSHYNGGGATNYDASLMFKAKPLSTPNRTKPINRQNNYGDTVGGVGGGGEGNGDDDSCNQLENSEANDMIIKLMTELESTKKQCIIEEQKVAELEEQLIAFSEFYLFIILFLNLKK